MYSEPEIDTATRMRDAHTAAASALAVALDGEREAWGWRGRTLGRPVTSVSGNAWLRLVCAPVEKAGGKIWDGPQEAERFMPPAVPRPHLQAWHTWTDGGNGYLAELYDRITDPTITTDGPLLRSAPAVGDTWWESLGTTLTAVAAVPTDRVAMRQEYLDRAMPHYLGDGFDTTVPAWSTAHGDLHWANLTQPTLTVLDWEGWGVAPTGYDAAVLHAYSLLVPETAAEIRHHLGHILDTPAGRFAELVVATELLQGIERGDHTELEGPLRARISHLIELRG
ncbi:hypothetical protein GCM10020229_80210 [Kitasatospora albolonga]|uniref:hypothetical protein n=1 Tax=Kitasatospora albolonga TaxID=68173 RepID=UPI0031EB3B49